MNVLLTCAGRSNSLVHYFQEALGDRGLAIACDASDSAPALAAAQEKILVPSVDHPDYFDVLVAICRERRVRLLVSVNDLEIIGLARYAAHFHDVGTIPIVASPEIVATCHDKWAAFRWLRAHGLQTPDTYASLADARTAIARGVLRFPLMVKPRWGSRSIGIEVAENQRELELAIEWGKIQLPRTILAKISQADPEHAFVIQERIEGQEYGIDVVNNLKGQYAATLARRKLAIRGGNTDRAVSVIEPRLEQLGRTLGQHLAHPGSVDCDVMVTDKGCLVLDMNPRFGGGYPFSHQAGANLPAALIAWANGDVPDPSWLRSVPGVLSSRYDSLMMVDRVFPVEAAGVRTSIQTIQTIQTGQDASDRTIREVSFNLGALR
ncbi:MAG: ATP-grasp domain-containing protein [Acidobacteriota bacterium]